MAEPSSTQTRSYDGPGTLVFYAKNRDEAPTRNPPTIFDQYLAVFQKHCKIGT